jgi:hypothetical protein
LGVGDLLVVSEYFGTGFGLVNAGGLAELKQIEAGLKRLKGT